MKIYVSDYARARRREMNIYDIAKLAGVSIATVSRVVNDSPRVSEKTKQKVRAVMEECPSPVLHDKISIFIML